MITAKRLLPILLVCMWCLPVLAQEPISWTRAPVSTANTNRDGTGTVVLAILLEERQYIDSIKCYPLGTNVATEGVLILNNGSDLALAANNAIIGIAPLPATTTGSIKTSDVITYQIGAWLPKGYRIYALVHDNQAAGRQFVVFTDGSYQTY